MMHWRFLTLPLLVNMLACATATIPGGTKASPKLQQDAVEMISMIDGAREPGCAERKVVNTEIVRRATVEDVTAMERWTIERCGKLYRYNVVFRQNSEGGTDITVWAEK
jgi:hypothetical protein